MTPQSTTETIVVEGLSAPAEIAIDRWGIPHLRASNRDDLFFVQGFNAARDRLRQIDLWRKRGAGLARRRFRARLLGVHSRYGLHTRAVTNS